LRTNWRGTSAMPFSVARLDAGCPSGCSAPNGLCIMGSCVCRKGYSGVSCEVHSGEQCGKQGCENGICVNSKCVCMPGWTSEHCDQRESCDCENGGVCENDQCSCRTGFHGKRCEKKKACKGGCNNKGICFRGEVCVCQPGYAGDSCEKISLDLPDVNCPKSKTFPDAICSGHGSCSALKHCECDVHWSGEACDVKSNDASCLNDCNGQKCELDGSCSCDAGFEGPDCGKAVQCNGGRGCGIFEHCFRGVCVGIQNSKVLGENNLVDPLSVTPSDASEICPRSCSFNGICFEGACLCNPKFSGVACEFYNGKPIADMKEEELTSCPIIVVVRPEVSV